MERRRRDLLFLAAENSAERPRDLSVTASLDLDHGSRREVLLRAVLDFHARVEAEQPGTRDHGRGSEREQGNSGNDPAQHAGSLTTFSSQCKSEGATRSLLSAEAALHGTRCRDVAIRCPPPSAVPTNGPAFLKNVERAEACLFT